jgi:hypothetical protein
VYLFIWNGKETGKVVLIKQLQQEVTEDTGASCGTLQQIVEEREFKGSKRKYGMRMNSR